MTTTSWASVIDHTSDAGFRAWGAEIAARFIICGGVQTADTGQINWATVNRPGSNTDAGYEILRLATGGSNLFFKVFYGTGSLTTLARMRIQVGTGSNGSGTLTGQLSAVQPVTNEIGTSSPSIAYVSRMCIAPSQGSAFQAAWSLSWKEQCSGSGGTVSNGGFFVIGPTVLGSGVPSVVGFGILSVAANNVHNWQCVRTQAPAFSGPATQQALFVIPNDPTNSLADTGDYQAYQISGAWPTVLPFYWACVVQTAEAPRGVTFSVAMVGSTPRTFVAVGQFGTAGMGPGTIYGTGKYTYGMIHD